MQESRLFKIVYYLLDKGQATAPELAARFEVSVRTIYRDIDALSSAGIPVYAEAGRKGGIRLLEDFVLDQAVLSEGEKQEILAALPCRASILPGISVKARPCRNFPPCFSFLRRTGSRWIFPDGAIRGTTRKSSDC